MSALKAVIFDVDGTMADTERDGHRVAFNRAFTDNGLDWHWDPLLYGELLAVTGGKERIRYYLENFHLQCRFFAADTAAIGNTIKPVDSLLAKGITQQSADIFRH